MTDMLIAFLSGLVAGYLIAYACEYMEGKLLPRQEDDREDDAL